MWELYDRLIEGVPKNIVVDHIHCGETWTIVHAESYCGFAVMVNEQQNALPSGKEWIGKDLYSVASLCKSWDFPLASIGTAALNAYYNSSEIASLSGAFSTENAFTDYAKQVAGKKVTIIGHFIHLERHLIEAEETCVLERKPEDGDYPDSACEYLLPMQDYVFITGSAFINKTLPRLLQLSQNGKAVIVGPSTPLSPVLFEYGADELSGLMPDYLPLHKVETVGRGGLKMSHYGTRVRLLP